MKNHVLSNIEVLNFARNGDELKRNSHFINVLTELQELTMARKILQKRTMTEIEELISEIETETRSKTHSLISYFPLIARPGDFVCN